MSRKIQEQKGRLMGELQENISGIFEIQGNKAENDKRKQTNNIIIDTEEISRKRDIKAAKAGLISAIHQGKVCAAGILMAAKRPEMAFKAGVVYAVMVEMYAILGLLVTLFLLLFAIKWPAVAAVAGA